MALRSTESMGLREDVKKLLEDTEFVKEVINTQDAKEAIKVFESRGVTITLDELSAVYDLIDKALSLGENGKLNETELENVSGGSLTVAALCAVAALGGGDLLLRAGRRINNKKADFEDLQTKNKELGVAAYNAVSDKKTKQHEIDNNIMMGVEAAGVSAALLMLNYYKKDISKFWRGKKKQMKKSIDINKGVG